MDTFTAALQWLAIGQKLLEAGTPLFNQFRALLASNGIDADTSALEKVISDSELRKAIAEREAQS